MFEFISVFSEEFVFFSDAYKGYLIRILFYLLQPSVTDVDSRRSFLFKVFYIDEVSQVGPLVIEKHSWEKFKAIFISYQ